MNNQDERFWSEFSEDEAKDPANRRILAALQDVYRIDEDDQRSVQRVWTRFAASMEQGQQQKQHISRFATLHEQSASFALVGAKKPVQRNRTRRHIDTLVALGIIFLLVGSMLGIIVLHNAGSSKVGGHPTLVATPTLNTSAAPKRLGKTLEQFYLGMSIKNFLRKQQETPVCYSVALDSLQTYRCPVYDLYISFGPVPYKASFQDKTSFQVIRLVAWGKFSGKTAEGLSSGMSYDQFQALYQKFQIHIEPLYKFQANTLTFPMLVGNPVMVAVVIDRYGTTLTVLFNSQLQVTEIVLQSGVFK